MFAKPDPPLTIMDKVKAFLAVHWRGVVCVLAPVILIAVLAPFPTHGYNWCGYTLLLMAVFWVTECVPLAVTSFLPVIIFPLTGLMSTAEVCKAYLSDAIMMFLGSIFLAYSVEQSGLHKRLAFAAIRLIGYSHVKLLTCLSCVTCFVSMWVTNTAATTMMVPINFALLKVFDDQKICKLYDTTPEGDLVSSDITSCYFCAVTYSATIGGIGTLVGTATNLAFKGLFQKAYPAAPELLSFPKFSGFAVPYMIFMEASTILIMLVQYFGLFRPKSATAKRAVISKKGIELAERAIKEESKKMGKFSFWEGIVFVLFAGAMISFFCRSPQIFQGWGDTVIKKWDIKNEKFVVDSTLAMLVCYVMFLLPSTLAIFKNCTAKYTDQMPRGKIPSVLDWTKVNAAMPFSFMFLLGGGVALSEAAESSGLNAKIGETLRNLKSLPNVLILFLIILLVIFITNFASNVAVANVMAPLAMQLAKEIKQNPLWYCIAAGFSASHCLMLPVGTPGNLIVQGAAKIPTGKMIKAGAGPTVAVLFWTWFFMSFYAPIVWPELKTSPEWAK